MRAHPAGPRHGEIMVPPGAPTRPTDAGALDTLSPLVWPMTSTRTTTGVIAVGGVGVDALAQEFGTPLFVLDETDFRARAQTFRAAYDDPELPGEVFFAGKAFLSITTVRWIQQEGLALDVCTGGELLVALRAGFPASSIAFHGNNKSVAEIVRALDAGVGRFVVDSLEEIDRLAVLATQRGIRPGVLVRVTVGVEAHTHEFIATAHEDQKFGLSLASGAAEEAVRAILARPSLELLGLHSHIGSQIFDTAGFEVAAHRVVGLAARIRDEHGIEVTELDLGGGMGIAYTEDDDPVDVTAMAAQIRRILTSECEAAGLPRPRLLVEPGRAIVGPAMITVYEVGTVKTVELGSGHVRTYVSVDGGMSDNIRTALYDADYTVRLANRTSDADPVLARVVGKHCESGDIVIRDAWLPGDVAPGDLLAVAATGAYCRSMASNYNQVPRPPVIAVREGGTAVVLRRETEEDLLALDPGADLPVSTSDILL